MAWADGSSAITAAALADAGFVVVALNHPGDNAYQGHETPHRESTLDARIKAAVIADPAFTFLFGEDDLKEVAVPLQLWSSRLGGAGVSLENVAAIDRKLAFKAEFHLVTNAAHWAFLAPCPAEFAKANPRNCIDPGDFDRAGFHQEFNAAMLAFFRAHLADGAKP